MWQMNVVEIITMLKGPGALNSCQYINIKLEENLAEFLMVENS
jgi:hypothetical protein